MTSPPLLSLVIPAYNEEKRLPPTLERIANYLDSSPYADAEIVVVDDGSRDSTAAIAEAAARTGTSHTGTSHTGTSHPGTSHPGTSHKDPRIRLLRNPGNRGKGYSVRHGMLEARGEWILFSDADLSAPIEELPKLMDAVQAHGAAIAIGSRALDRSLIGVHQSRWREVSGIFFNRVMRLLTGLEFADTQCGFKLYHRDAARLVFALQRLEGFGFDVEDLYIARRLGLRAIEVPVRWNNVEGTKVGLLDGARSFTDLLLVRWNGLRGRYRCEA